MGYSQNADHKSPGDGLDDYRNQFLIEMYRQMWANINRHILVVWQSVSVLLGTFAVFALVEKQIVSLDFASTLVVIIAAWLVAHAIDANYWFNRNMAIVSNIERQFFRPTDLCLIHSYFGGHRKAGPLLDHLLVQASLGFAVCSGFWFTTSASELLQASDLRGETCKLKEPCPTSPSCLRPRCCFGGIERRPKSTRIFRETPQAQSSRSL